MAESPSLSYVKLNVFCLMKSATLQGPKGWVVLSKPKQILPWFML